MTISRGQMNRQLYMGGGIMNVVPREPAIFGGIKRAVKKVVGGVKDIASSDIGKAALAGAAVYGLGGGFGPGGFSFGKIPGAGFLLDQVQHQAVLELLNKLDYLELDLDNF